MYQNCYKKCGSISDNKTNPYKDPQFKVAELINPRDCDNRLILAMYPYTLRCERILQDNLPIMIETIRDYIREVESHMRLTKVLPRLIWDSQKLAIQEEINLRKRNMEQLRNKMNTGISPFYWCLYKEFNGYIDGTHYKADYLISLEQPDTPTFWQRLENKRENNN